VSKVNKGVKMAKAIAEAYGRSDDMTFLQGGRHIKVYLSGKFVTVIPNGNPREKGRGVENNIAEIRRALEGRSNERH